jgi:hypothetical protein
MSVTKINPLTLFMGIAAYYCDNHIKCVHKACAKITASFHIHFYLAHLSQFCLCTEKLSTIILSALIVSSSSLIEMIERKTVHVIVFVSDTQIRLSFVKVTFNFSECFPSSPPPPFTSCVIETEQTYSALTVKICECSPHIVLVCFA